MARRTTASKHRSKSRRDADKRRKTSLFRKLSSKKATQEMQQQLASSSVSGQQQALSASQSLQSLPMVASGQAILRNTSISAGVVDSGNSDSCLSSSPADSTPCSPASGANAVTPTSTSTRPSSLHGLKHKLHVKTLHSPSRRKSVGHIPLSPLARTPSPSPVPVSPTRSPSPLALPLAGHHPAGASNTTQTYSPGSSLTPGSAKKSFTNRPKSAEPGSPLLRRALSPDRLHPRAGDGKKSTTISPLCNPAQCMVVVSTSPKLTIATQSITSRTSGEVSPLPSRALHTSPSVSGSECSGSPDLLLRKHSKSSLTQATIPEEEPEFAEDPEPTMSGKPLSFMKPKPESRAVKNLAQELGARTKEVAANIKKSSSFKEEKKQQQQPKEDLRSSQSEPTKSPKLSRQESMERTLRGITKVIRGTSRSESRSKKKDRDSSLSPKGGSSSSSGCSKKEDREEKIKDNSKDSSSHSKGGGKDKDKDSSARSGGKDKDSSSKSSKDKGSGGGGGSKISRKDSGKKSAQEKRDLFKSLH